MQEAITSSPELASKWSFLESQWSQFIQIDGAHSIGDYRSVATFVTTFETGLFRDPPWRIMFDLRRSWGLKYQSINNV